MARAEDISTTVPGNHLTDTPNKSSARSDFKLAGLHNFGQTTASELERAEGQLFWELSCAISDRLNPAQSGLWFRHEIEQWVAYDSFAHWALPTVRCELEVNKGFFTTERMQF